MTYRTLITELQKLDEDQLDCDVTIEVENEEFFTADLVINHSTNHPYFSAHDLLRSRSIGF